MGSHEFLVRRSQESIRGIVELKTPSPLTSSDSSDSSSLLSGINELIKRESLHKLYETNIQRSTSAKVKEEYSDFVDSGKNPTAEDTSSSIETSLTSSASSLKRRLRDLPSAREAIKYSNRLTALDHRIRQQRDVYLQLHGSYDPIDEQDEGDTDSCDEILSPVNLFDINQFNFRPNDARARRRAKMSSSAPETMRTKNENCDRLLSLAENLSKPRLTRFDECRAPKYLQPIDPPSREILRNNAPPLCLTNKKIADSLRRGSASAREEYSKKISSKGTSKFAAYGKPTGMIVKNLSSSEDDNSPAYAESRLIRGTSSSRIKKIDQELPPTEVNGARMGMAPPREINHVDEPVLPQRSEIPMENSLRNSMAQLKNVLRDLEVVNSHDSGKLNVPKLDIKSQEYSRSTSIGSKVDTTKRSLDVNELIRILSDLSTTKQQEITDRRILSTKCDGTISESTGPQSTVRDSIRNGSRQSATSLEKTERLKTRNEVSMATLNSEASKNLEVKRNDKHVSNRPKNSVVSNRETYYKPSKHREIRKVSRRKITKENSEVLVRDCFGSSLGRSPSAKSMNSINSQQIKVQPNSTILKNKANVEKRPFRVKNNVHSFNSLYKTHETQEGIMRDTRNGKFSEPGTFRNRWMNLTDSSSSGESTDIRDVIMRDVRDDRETLDDRFKYLQRGCKIPHVGKSGSSSSEQGNIEARTKASRLSMNGFHGGKRRSHDSFHKQQENPLKQITMTNGKQNERSASVAKFVVYEETFEDTTKQELPLKPNQNLDNDIDSCRLFEQCHIFQKDCSPEANENQDDEKRDNEIPNLFWADNLSESNRGMTSRFDSQNEASDLSRSRSCLISPRKSPSGKKYRSFHTKNLSKESSRLSSSITGSSDTPRHNNNARRVCKNLVVGMFDNVMINKKEKLAVENICSSNSIVKKLSYTELQEPEEHEECTDQKLFTISRQFPVESTVSLPNDVVNDKVWNSSQTNIMKTGKSESAVDPLSKVLDVPASRGKISSSVSILDNSPEEPRTEFPNCEERTNSQDRFPCTMTESKRDKSSSTIKIERKNRGTSGYGYSETNKTTSLRIHPSLLRLAGQGVEYTPAEIIDSISHNSAIVNSQKRRFVPKIRRFVGKLSRWRKSRKRVDKTKSTTIRILYENKHCRGVSAGQSSGSMNASVEKHETRYNRDGSWVAGLGDKSRMANDQFFITKNTADAENEKYSSDRHSTFLTNTEIQNPCEFRPKTRMNSLLFQDEDADINLEQGCLCLKFCRFLISGSVHKTHRHSFLPQDPI